MIVSSTLHHSVACIMMDLSSRFFGLNMYAGHIRTTSKLFSFVAAKVTLILMTWILWNPNNKNGANRKIEEVHNK